MEQRFVKDVEWLSFNRDTYELTGAEPLSEGFRPFFDRRFRIAIVSLFSMESAGPCYIIAPILGGFKPKEASYLKGVYENPGVAIFEVALKNRHAI